MSEKENLLELCNLATGILNNESLSFKDKDEIMLHLINPAKYTHLLNVDTYNIMFELYNQEDDSEEMGLLVYKKCVNVIKNQIEEDLKNE